MSTYRILWTYEDVPNGGWYGDVDAADAPTAAWQTAATRGPGQDGKPPVLVSVTELPAEELPADG